MELLIIFLAIVTTWHTVKGKPVNINITIKHKMDVPPMVKVPDVEQPELEAIKDVAQAMQDFMGVAD